MVYERKFDIPEDVIEGVVRSLPSIMNIQAEDLRNKVIRAWALSLYLSGWKSLDELPGSGRPNLPTKGNQSQHIECVAKMTVSSVSIMEDVLDYSLVEDKDLLWACALCHDLGKPYEYAPENRKRWTADPAAEGLPCLRHTLYGVYIALLAGLPDAVAHAAGCHSPEGDIVQRSLDTMIIHMVDDTYWQALSVKLGWGLPKP